MAPPPLPKSDRLLYTALRQGIDRSISCPMSTRAPRLIRLTAILATPARLSLVNIDCWYWAEYDARRLVGAIAIALFELPPLGEENILFVSGAYPRENEPTAVGNK